MTNTEALKTMCNALCNTFYPDTKTVELMLYNESIDKEAMAIPKDERLFRVAVRLVKGYVESSRNENGVSTSVNRTAVNGSIIQWCKDYGLDADDFVLTVKTIENASNRW